MSSFFDFSGEGKKWKERYEREKEARKAAEDLLEQKSLEIYNANEALKKKIAEAEQMNLDLTNAYEEVQSSQEELRQTMEELMASNDEMARVQKELKATNSKLKESEAELERKVEERTREFLHAKEAAERANRVKSEFLANMSHELRTPLNAILGYAQILSEAKDLAAEHREKIKIVNKSGEHLLQLINTVLDLSKIEAGKVELNYSDFDLLAMLQSIYDMFRLRCESKGLKLLFEVQANVPRYVQTDEGKLRQSLINIIGNAVKFTNQGHVNLFVTRDETGETVFRIEDTGRGIPADKLKAVLEPFTQIQAYQNTEGGTGLGLSITKSFIQMMGGSIDVESELGRGSAFTVKLPLDELESIGNVEESLNNRTIIGLQNDEKFKILVVDDVAVNRDVACSILAPLGFVLETANDGQQGIEKTLTWKPDMVLMDIRMPNIDGLQATKVIRQTLRGNEVKIIAVTASAFDQNRAEFLAQGCDGYIAKPYKKNFLLEEMAKHLPLQFIYEDVSDDAPLEMAASSQSIEYALAKTHLTDKFVAELEDNIMIGRLEGVKTAFETLESPAPEVVKLQKYANALVDEMDFDALEQMIQTLKQA